MKYLIRNDIVFIPNEGLYLPTSNTVEVKLSLIADRLLLLLISSKRDVVSKQQIHDFLWKECGIDASTASINNNLVFLRRTFKDLGIDNFIITTPKVGVSLIQDVSIIVLEERPPLPRDSVAVIPISRRKKLRIFIGFSILVLIGVVLVLYYLFFYNIKKKGAEYITTINDCKVLSPSALSRSEREQLIYFVTDHLKLDSVACKKNNVIIASIQKKGVNPMQSGRGFFSLCEVEENYVYSCVNYYYFNGAK